MGRGRRIATILLQGVLGVAFVFYGAVKVAGGQFNYSHDWVLSGRDTDGPSLVWAFYGWSPVYGRLIGLAELAAGLLVLVPRTRTLGALVLLPVVANITVMDFCFDFPDVKYTALTLTVLCLLLLALDHRRLLRLGRVALTPEGRPAAPGPEVVSRPDHNQAAAPLGHATGDPGTPTGGRRRALRYVAALVLLLPVGGFLANVFLASLSGPVEAAAAVCREHGWKREDLALRGWRTHSWSGFHEAGEVEFQTRRGEPAVVHVSVYRPTAFVGWRVTDYREMHAAE